MKTDWRSAYQNVEDFELRTPGSFYDKSGKSCSAIYDGVRTSIAKQVWPFALFIWDDICEK